MKFTRIPESAFEEIQLNAGILLTNFVPNSATVADDAILGATSGGISFTAEPDFTDFGEDIDNCPTNTLQLKRRNGWTVTMSGTFVTINVVSAMKLIGSTSSSITGSSGPTKITPLEDLDEDDFSDLWWVGDYSDKNGDTNGGFVAIHMLNSLSTGGFQFQSGNREKGQFSFEFTGHYSITDQTTVPFEVYIKDGADE